MAKHGFCLAVKDDGDRSKTAVCHGPMIEGDSVFPCAAASAEFGAMQPVKIRVPPRMHSVCRPLFPQQLEELRFDKLN